MRGRLNHSEGLCPLSMPICFLWCLLGIPMTSHGCYMV